MSISCAMSKLDIGVFRYFLEDAQTKLEYECFCCFPENFINRIVETLHAFFEKRTKSLQQQILIQLNLDNLKFSLEKGHKNTHICYSEMWKSINEPFLSLAVQIYTLVVFIEFDIWEKEIWAFLKLYTSNGVVKFRSTLPTDWNESFDLDFLMKNSRLNSVEL